MAQDLFNGTRYTDFFDDGPIVVTRVNDVESHASGSIDASAVDPYRQGVELKTWKHFDAGTVKIHSGEPNHVIKRSWAGMATNIDVEPRFIDVDGVDPVMLVSASIIIDLTLTNRIKMPVQNVKDNRDGALYDGVIEPFTVRTHPSTLNLGITVTRTVKGDLVGGETDSAGASSFIDSLHHYEPTRFKVPFLDSRSSAVKVGQYELGIRATTTFVEFVAPNTSIAAPLSDTRYICNREESSRQDNDIKVALSSMTGSTDNYTSIARAIRSAPAGWDYDNNQAIGTDSLAFGGMTY